MLLRSFYHTLPRRRGGLAAGGGGFLLVGENCFARPKPLGFRLFSGWFSTKDTKGGQDGNYSWDTFFLGDTGQRWLKLDEDAIRRASLPILPAL